MLVENNGIQRTASAILGAIQDAARATGAKFEYLLATARIESGLNPSASARSSSASGLYQFIDQTWLTTLKEAGPELGYGRYADQIVKLPSGQYDVPDPEARRAILNLKSDPAVSAAIAGAFTGQNAARLEENIGRKPTEGELYIAHFLGAAGASRLISLATASPNASAVSAFPNAAHANPSIFFNQGQARSVREVYNTLVGRYQVARGTPEVIGGSKVAFNNPISRAAPRQVIPPAESPATPSGPLPGTKPVFRSLFSDETPRTPGVSPIVTELWSTRPRVAAALTLEGGRAERGGQGSNAALELFSNRQPNVRALFRSES